jgi:hypothetical protein
LVFTQTSKASTQDDNNDSNNIIINMLWKYTQGIFCTKCHEARKQSRLKKKNKQQQQQQQQEPPANFFRNSSTTSIVNSYAQDDIRTPILGKAFLYIFVSE